MKFNILQDFDQYAGHIIILSRAFGKLPDAAYYGIQKVAALLRPVGIQALLQAFQSVHLIVLCHGLRYAVGIQNILSLIQIEYVHRINYRNLPTASEHGIRFVINPSF